MSPERVATILSTMRGRWMTAPELRAAASIGDLNTCRRWLTALSAAGVCRMRARPKVMGEDGNKPAGQMPREYRLHSDFGGLA